ncbi:MAG: hypothetical protein ACXVEE_13925 [Polyangiales bacterium]
MSAALVIVLVAMGDGDDPSTRAMTRTTQEVLGEKSVVLIREVPAMPGDAEAGTLAASAHATAIVELAWSPDRREAHLRVRTGDGTWTERAVTFQPSDPPGERGRLLAYAVSTMVPTMVPPEAPAEAAPIVDRAVAPKPPALVTKPFFGWIGVAVDRASDARIERRSYGASVRAAYAPRIFGVGITLGARSGAVDAVDATATTFRAAVGPVVAFRMARYAGLTLSADFGTAYVRLERSGFGHDGRFLPALSFALEAVLGPERTSVVLGVGLEQMLGNTDVFVDRTHIGALPRTRAVLGIGVRVRF